PYTCNCCAVDCMKTVRVIFLFTNSRDELIERVRRGEEADTPLKGMNHVPGATWAIAPPKSLRTLTLIPQLLTYDFVIAQDTLFLGYLVSTIAYVFRLRTRWLYIAINSSTLMRRFAKKRVRLWFLKLFWGSYARIICISHEQLEDFVRLGISRNKLMFIPY